MAIRLTTRQQLALDAAESLPPEVVDPRNEESYVLVPISEYRDLRELAEEDVRRQAICRVGLRNAAGRLKEAR